MDPNVRNQDQVADESTGVDQAVADTTGSAEAVPAAETVAETAVQEGTSEEPISEGE